MWHSKKNLGITGKNMAVVLTPNVISSLKKIVKFRRNISKLTSIITRPTGCPPAVTSKKTLGQAIFYEMFEILDDFFWWEFLIFSPLSSKCKCSFNVKFLQSCFTRFGFMELIWHFLTRSKGFQNIQIFSNIYFKT